MESLFEKGIKKFRDNIGDLYSVVEKVFFNEARKQEEILADFNREQLFDGKREDGSDIKPSYKPSTVKIKKIKGQKVSNVTLKDTGKFHRSIKVDVGGKEMEYSASDSKFPKLQDKYKGKSTLLGLTKPNRVEFVSLIAPYVGEEVWRRLVR